MLWWTFLARSTATTARPIGRIARRRGLPGPAHWFWLNRRRIRLQERRLAFHNRLLLVLFLFDMRLRRPFGLRGRIELGAHEHDGPLLFIRFHAHHQLVLRIVQELGEFLETVRSAR